MVEDGTTDAEPDGTATAPMPWSRDAEVAFVVVHESDAPDPWRTETGIAESVQVGGGGVTVIIAEQGTLPPAPLAVMV